MTPLFSHLRAWGVSQNIGKAVELFQKAAEHGYDVAQYNLGVCCRSGEGVDLDIDRMIHLYKLAADQGIADRLARSKIY